MSDRRIDVRLMNSSDTELKKEAFYPHHRDRWNTLTTRFTLLYTFRVFISEYNSSKYLSVSILRRFDPKDCGQRNGTKRR